MQDRPRSPLSIAAMSASRLAILTLILGLGVGFGLGFLQGGTASSLVAAAGPGGSGIAMAGPEPSALSSAEAQLDPVGPSAPLKSTSAAPVITAEAKRLAQRVSAEAAAAPKGESTWNSVIRGSVIDEAGEPLAGVTVLSTNGYRNYRSIISASPTKQVGRAYSGPSDLEESVAKTAASRIRSRRNTREATTDENGQFELTGLKEGMHQLGVYAEGFTFSDLEHETGSDVELVGKPVTVFILNVRLPDGSAPNKAVVQVTEERRGNSHYTWTPEVPEIRLTRNNIGFRVFSGNERRLDWRETIADFTSKEMSLNVDRDGSGPHLVELGATQLCQVSVTDTSGLVPVIRPWVKIATAEAHAANGFAWGGEGVVSLVREEGARFAAKDLPEGSYVVGIGRGGEEPEITEPLQILGGITALEVSLGDVDLSRFMVVQCVGPARRPVNEVAFSRSVAGKHSSSSGGVTALSRRRGEYWIPLSTLLGNKTWEDIESATLVSTSKDFGILNTDLTESTTNLQLTFSMPCELIVVVTGDYSAGIRATILEHTEGDELNKINRRYASYSSGNSSKKVDADGRALFTGKQPGQYEVTLTKSGIGDDGYSGWNKPHACKEIVTLREGTNEVSMTLPTFHDLLVYAPGQKKGLNLQLKPAAASPEDYSANLGAELGEDERATFKDVPAGSYTLSSWGAQSTTMNVSVPCGEVTFEVTEPNCLKVFRVEPGKAADEAGLKAGDFITAMDGQPMNSQIAIQIATMKLMSSKVKFTVVRGASELTVEMGPLGETQEAMQNMGFSAMPHTRE